VVNEASRAGARLVFVRCRTDSPVGKENINYLGDSSATFSFRKPVSEAKHGAKSHANRDKSYTKPNRSYTKVVLQASKTHTRIRISHNTLVRKDTVGFLPAERQQKLSEPTVPPT
jgi:hypothetical protein